MAREASADRENKLGDYDLLAKVGEGGVGKVYKARHRITRELVAIKVMIPELAENPILLERFKQEFAAARVLNHPNIVRALRHCIQGKTPFLVMEWVEGESVGAKLEREGALPEAEAVSIITQVCKGLHQAHKQGITHRDIKPDNILVTPDGKAKLADMGLVKRMEAQVNLTRTGRGLGTPNFMAPEQFRDAKHADALCDIYSLGATLYQMVTGDLPFRANNPVDMFTMKMRGDLTPPRQRMPTLSEQVENAIQFAIRADPDQRPASCLEFIAALEGKEIPRRQPSSRPDLPAPRQSTPGKAVPVIEMGRQEAALASPDSPGVFALVKPVLWVLLAGATAAVLGHLLFRQL
jgi:serine/threonine protein kinase